MIYPAPNIFVVGVGDRRRFSRIRAVVLSRGWRR